jgi:cell division protein FtsZ
MAEVNRVMEQIGRHCEHAQIIMGAVVDSELKNRLSVTLIAAKHNAAAAESLAASSSVTTSGEPGRQATQRGANAAPASRCATQPAAMLEQREQLLTRSAGRPRRANPKMRQEQLPLAIISKGRFDKSEPTVHKGEDLDIPTFVRRGVALN